MSNTLTKTKKLYNFSAQPVKNLLNDADFSTAVNTRITTETGKIKTGSATKSGNGSATTFTIAHGLSGTPTFFQVQAANAASVGISYVTADATNITVTHTSAPANGTDNLKYNWIAKL